MVHMTFYNNDKKNPINTFSRDASLKYRRSNTADVGVFDFKCDI